ncbi:MAG: ROK family protein [Lentisphaerae bacterium]|nr:ROK family protein [Lentisphaerota bacterium]
MKSVEYKQNSILRQVRRRGAIIRRELASDLGISNSRVCDVVDHMVSDELLLEELLGDERRGRGGAPVRVNPEHGYVAGFDFEATRMRLVVVNFAGQAVWQTKASLDAKLERRELLETVLSFIDGALSEARTSYPKLLGLGLATCGMVDSKRGVVLRYDMMPGAYDLPLRDLASARFDLPCLMENNMRALTLAEWMQGAAQHLDTFVCLAVRSGIGAGIVMNGRLLNGSHGFAGEVGYMGVTDGSGGRHRLHEFVGEQALGLDAEAGSLTPSRARRVGGILGSQLASIASLIDPEAIVLAGSLLQPQGALWDHVVAAFREVAMPEQIDCVHLVPARLGPFAAAIGAANLCLQSLNPTEGTRSNAL